MTKYILVKKVGADVPVFNVSEIEEVKYWLLIEGGYMICAIGFVGLSSFRSRIGHKRGCQMVPFNVTYIFRYK